MINYFFASIFKVAFFKNILKFERMKTATIMLIAAASILACACSSDDTHGVTIQKSGWFGHNAPSQSAPLNS